ncbi:tRNA dimethylallyltransferase 2-like [Carica papaya]|uniref:tRNA dimethylallyltransferase 2-like n=1 Tax=Carica papaya TaxID=3649 RepID=UPI000B8CFD4D|nr:tRNA dimethylallyltransferase 2-like [Carica papaya]
MRIIQKIPKDNGDKVLKEKMRAILNSPRDNKQKILLEEAINKVKLNTRRLVHRQKRRVNRLQTFFGWNIHYVDATEYVSRKSDESWVAQVVEPAVMIIKSFLNENLRSVFDLEAPNSAVVEPVQRDLWTQYVCQVSKI